MKRTCQPLYLDNFTITKQPREHGRNRECIAPNHYLDTPQRRKTRDYLLPKKNTWIELVFNTRFLGISGKFARSTQGSTLHDRCDQSQANKVGSVMRSTTPTFHLTPERVHSISHSQTCGTRPYPSSPTIVLLSAQAIVTSNNMTSKSSRRKPPTNVQRLLWAESLGHCMNPDCQTNLIEANGSIGECAHIIPDSQGGDVTFDNMILLCATCHTKYETLNSDSNIILMRVWKNQRSREIDSVFSHRFTTFDELSDIIRPLLEKNQLIFKNYGPLQHSDSQPSTREQWILFEPEILANNAKIVALLNANLTLFHAYNQRVIRDFELHTDEFTKTRDDDNPLRRLLFPDELLSIFSLQPVSESMPFTVSVLQNLVSHFVSEGKFSHLSFHPDPVLIYEHDDGFETLQLDDGPRIRQILFTNFLYRPEGSNVNVKEFTFFLNWLFNNNIHYEFKNNDDITEITVNGNFVVRLVNEYTITEAHLHEMKLNKGDAVLNVYHSNYGSYTDEAYEYARSIGCQIFTKPQFYVYAHNYLK